VVKNGYKREATKVSNICSNFLCHVPMKNGKCLCSEVPFFMERLDFASMASLVTDLTFWVIIIKNVFPLFYLYDRVGIQRLSLKSGSVDFWVLLSLFLILFLGIISTSYMTPQKESKIILKIDEPDFNGSLKTCC